MNAVTWDGISADETREDASSIADATRGLVLRHVLASTLLLLVSGALGVLLRQSQANIKILSPAVWYQVMTAHGLGAFVGWAAFALMGISWWVLHENGFILIGWSRKFAEVAWWTMILGVAGVVITVLGLGFAGSWVFLYPLPFEAAGEWTRVATALFSFSVLLVGVSIISWCCGILGCVTGPGLGAESRGVFNRFFCALGLGILWPKRFRTDRPLPFAIIPLTVIAIDMIIATIPLAVLLVEMIVQAADSSVSIDPLLAKSMLWWFGHPVVYLLLFPAVAIYYHLIPRFAGRPLVAGHVIAVGWMIGVVSNVIIGAHHMYTDFPDTFQQVVNTGMQPLTYAVTIPSALSLFSIALTIYRSPYNWSPAGTAIALALVSWLVAGFQGVGLATIQYDVVAHNTLWVVGHFHNMALLNIGIVIFAALYAFIPALVGRQWASNRLAYWHIGLTIVGGYGSVMPWMIQGLEGAPRRFAELPDRYSSMSTWSLPFVAMIAVGQLLFVVNLLQTLGFAWWKPVLTPATLSEPLASTSTPREQPREAFAGLLAAAGIGLAIPALFATPFVWGRSVSWSPTSAAPWARVGRPPSESSSHSCSPSSASSCSGTPSVTGEARAGIVASDAPAMWSSAMMEMRNTDALHTLGRGIRNRERQPRRGCHRACRGRCGATPDRCRLRRGRGSRPRRTVQRVRVRGLRRGDAEGGRPPAQRARPPRCRDHGASARPSRRPP